MGVITGQNSVESLLADVFREVVSERIVPSLPKRLSPFRKDVAKVALASAAAKESILILQGLCLTVQTNWIVRPSPQEALQDRT
jgi:hypothetical protein